MTLVSRIRLLGLITICSILAMAIVVYRTIDAAKYYVDRVAWAHYQLESIIDLSRSVARFSEQLAETLVAGAVERDDFEASILALDAGFEQLERATIGETAFLVGAGEAPELTEDFYVPQSDAVEPLDDDQREEFTRISRMHEITREIEAVARDVFALSESGRQAEAARRFIDEIENRLDGELNALLTEAIVDERAETAEVERSIDALIARLSWLAVAAMVLTTGLCLAFGRWLVRSIRRPVALLVEGADRVGHGDLGHRIDYAVHDELGHLARRFNDMAEARQAQQALLLDAQSNLEGLVARRTAELGAANQRLTELGEQRTRFLADVSHELRTPLTALRGEAEIALRHGSKPESVYRDTLGRIVGQSEEMARLVDDLLLLARSEADTVRFDMRRVALGPLVVEAAHDAEVLGQAKSIDVVNGAAPDGVWVQADPQRLKQLTIILIENAIKFSRPGDRVHVAVDGGPDEASIRVRDNGPGIAAEDVPHVFDRFYRGRGAGDAAGSGLGLSIAKWIVEKHGGEITLASEQGVSTEFRVRLPRVM